MLALKLLLPLAVLAAPYQPQALDDVKIMVRSNIGCGEQPVVVFDLDDTLINSRERTRKILLEFADDSKNRFPIEASKLLGIRSSEIQYLLKNTFALRGITSEFFLKEAIDFWTIRFFSDAYASKDSQISGAAAYVRQLDREGAHIVYLTGRDIPNMQRGTLESLRNLGFPQGKLLMKPRAEMGDLEFKKAAIPKIRALGPVVGVFENEPANLNFLHEAFPAAIAVFLDTIHSPKPDRPFFGAAWVDSFL